jgi:hypothetical protein
MDGATPAKVPDAVIAEIRTRERQGAIDLPSNLRPGERVRVVRGPFRDQLAIYATMSGRDRVAVLLRLLGGGAGSFSTDLTSISDGIALAHHISHSRRVVWLSVFTMCHCAPLPAGCRQLNVGRQPAYVPTRPLGPLPIAIRTDEPRQDAHLADVPVRLQRRAWLSIHGNGSRGDKAACTECPAPAPYPQTVMTIVPIRADRQSRPRQRVRTRALHFTPLYRRRT